MITLCMHRSSGLPLESTGVVQGALNGIAGALSAAGGAARRHRTHLTLLQRARQRH